MRGSKHPHVKASMFHGVDGINGMILREELLVIILVMISRLENEKFRKHAVVPVRHLHQASETLSTLLELLICPSFI